MQKEQFEASITEIHLGIGVPKGTINEVLLKLDILEKDLFFLTNKCRVCDIAILVKTNTTYLSKIVNVSKHCNFKTYINQMRIDYTVDKIKTDPMFSLFKISAIATEVGFNNVESFAKAFHKRVGCNPSQFIKEQGLL